MIRFLFKEHGLESVVKVDDKYMFSYKNGSKNLLENLNSDTLAKEVIQNVNIDTINKNLFSSDLSIDDRLEIIKQLTAEMKDESV